MMTQYDKSFKLPFVLPPEHPDNILAIANQGDVFSDQGKLTQAEPYYRQAAVEAKRILGAEHRSTLAAVNNHASVLSKLGQSPAGP